CRIVFDCRRPWYFRPSHAGWRVPSGPAGNPVAVHASSKFSAGHVWRPGMGYAVLAFAVWKASFGQFVRPPRLHRNLVVDRPRTPAFAKLVDEPHLAGLF